MSLLLRCFIFHLKATAAEGHLGISEAFQELHLERAGTSPIAIHVKWKNTH